MNVEFSLKFDGETKHNLHDLAGNLRNVLYELSEDLTSDSGVTRRTMQNTSERLGELLDMLAVITKNTDTAPVNIRPREDTVPPTPRGTSIGREMETSSRAIREYCWVVEQLTSIVDGTFTFCLTKDIAGVGVLLNYTPTVVRYDTDIAFDVPGYASNFDSERHQAQYLDRAIWSQKRAATKTSTLMTNLNSELPEECPDERLTQIKSSDSAYHTGGLTFRLARVGTTISLAVDRDETDVSPIRTLTTSNVVV